MTENKAVVKLSSRGQSLTEYALIIGVVAVAVVAALYFYKGRVGSSYRGAANEIAALDSGSSSGQTQSAADSHLSTLQAEIQTKWADPRLKLALLGLAFLMMCFIVFAQYRAQKKLKRTQSLSGEAGEDGQAMTEFVLGFPVLLLSILIIFQMSLIYLGHFMLNYAAFCAVRTAVVWIPQDLNQSQSGSSGQSGSSKEKENELFIADSAGDTVKIDKIRNAARLACAPISPPLSILINQRVQEVQNVVNNFNISTLSNLIDAFITSALSDFGQGMADKAKDAFAEIANPVNYLNPFGSFSSSTSSQSADSGSPIDLSNFLSSAFGNSISAFQNIQNYFAGLTGDSSTVLEGLEAPVIPEAPGVLGTVQRFFDKYAVSYLLTSVKIVDADLKEIEAPTKTFDANEDVIVEVRHWFHLGIPIANGIIGKKIYWWNGELRESRFAGLSPTGLPGQYYLLSSRCVMPNEGRVQSAKTPGAWEWFW